MAKTWTDWLIVKIEIYRDGCLEFTYNEIIEQAKQLHEQQIKDAYNQGHRDGKEDWDIVLPKDVAEYSNAQNYYNETFKNDSIR